MNNKELTDLYSQIQNIQKYLDEDDDDIDYNLIYEDYGLDIKQLETDMMNYSPKQTIFYEKLNNTIKDPIYETGEDTGFDLYTNEDLFIGPFGRKIISTGLSVELISGYEVQVRSKPSIVMELGLVALNLPGEHKGTSKEIKILLLNFNNNNAEIKKNTAIAQGIITSIINGKYVDFQKK
jgi:dUTPase